MAEIMKTTPFFIADYNPILQTGSRFLECDIMRISCRQNTAIPIQPKI